MEDCIVIWEVAHALPAKRTINKTIIATAMQNSNLSSDPYIKGKQNCIRSEIYGIIISRNIPEIYVSYTPTVCLRIFPRNLLSYFLFFNGSMIENGITIF